MPLFDLPLEELRTYTSAVTHPGDFDAFWGRTISDARGFPLAAVFEPVENYLSVIDTLDVTFSGYGGSPVKGWLHLPANRERGTPLPAVVQYAGYSSGRGLVNQDPMGAGRLRALIMDTRGQGYSGAVGETAVPHPSAGEVVLNYFDGVNLARSAAVPALCSVAQMDDVCPPSTVFASFNAYGTSAPEEVSKDIEVYRFNNLEGGQEHHWIRQLLFLRKLLR